jgi:hypothetical protein
MSTPDPTSATAGAAQVNREPAVVRVTPAGREEVAQVHHELAALGRRSPSLQLGAPLEEFAGDLGLAQWSSGSSGGVEVAIPGSGQRARGGPQTPRTVRRRSASTAPTASQVGSTTSKASSTRSASSGSTVPSTSGQASMAATSAAGSALAPTPPRTRPTTAPTQTSCTSSTLPTPCTWTGVTTWSSTCRSPRVQHY